MLPNYVNLASTVSGTNKKVFVSSVSIKDIIWWCEVVQPFIKKYEPYRADVNWNWGFLFKAYSRFSRYEFLKFTTLNEKGEEIILGLLLLDVKAKYLKDKRSKSVFIWYLSNLPTALAQGFRTIGFVNVGSILIDIALCTSFKYNNEGRMWLHAAKPNILAIKKGFDLVGYYSKVGMKRFNSTRSRINLFRINDGRYFYHTPSSARIAIRKLNKHRF